MQGPKDIMQTEFSFLTEKYVIANNVCRNRKNTLKCMKEGWS